MKRRPHGSGSKDLYRGQWRCRVYRDGKRITRLFDTEAEADSFLRGVQALAAAGEVRSSAPTLGVWGRGWVAGLRNRSAAADLSRWRTLVAPAPIAELELRQVDRPAVVAYLRWLERQRRIENTEGGKAKGDRPLSPQTRKHGLALVRRCLGAAADAGLIGTNPAVGVRMPRRDLEVVEDPWTFLTPEEIVLVINGPLPELRRLRYQAAIFGGMRQGELWCWEWPDVAPWDWRGAPTVSIRRGHGGPTKSGKPRRVVLLPLAAQALLRLWELADRPRTGLVFPAAKGGRRVPTDDGGWADRKIGPRLYLGDKTTCGITRRVRFHDLRHTCASHLVRGTWGRKWRLEEVKEYLGHSSIQVTQRYAHLQDGLADAAAATAGVGAQLGFKSTQNLTAMPSVGPVGFEPTTNGLKVLPEDQAAQGRSSVLAPIVPQARAVLAMAAAGCSIPGELAQALLQGVPAEDARLAGLVVRVVQGGPLAARALLEIARLVVEAEAAVVKDTGAATTRAQRPATQG